MKLHPQLLFRAGKGVPFMAPTPCCRPGTMPGIFASPCRVFSAHFTDEERQKQRDVCTVPLPLWCGTVTLGGGWEWRNEAPWAVTQKPPGWSLSLHPNPLSLRNCSDSLGT